MTRTARTQERPVTTAGHCEICRRPLPAPSKKGGRPRKTCCPACAQVHAALCKLEEGMDDLTLPAGQRGVDAARELRRRLWAAANQLNSLTTTTDRS